jgi:8-oxo-dGTP diphosphatase
MKRQLMLSCLLNYIESWVRTLVIFITDFLPVKVIRDDDGRPFLYRYHLFSLTKDGPGICFHHFVRSDPDRGFHSHPWARSMSFILCGGYDERILLNPHNPIDSTDRRDLAYKTIRRNRWRFNYLDGAKTYHRVMIEEGKDAWTIFFFQKRSKTWSMIGLDSVHRAMSTTISDQDGGWWKIAQPGLGLHSHLDNIGHVIATVDIIILVGSKILLIKRGKEPCKDCWAFPGGRIDQKDETIEAAAYRELKEETQVTDVKLNYFKTVGNNTRDPRGFSVTSIFTAKLDHLPMKPVKAGDDAVDYHWFELKELPEMAFDHRSIVDDYLRQET